MSDLPMIATVADVAKWLGWTESKLRARLHTGRGHPPYTRPADAALADEWNIEDLIATAVMYMRDVGMPNEADAIVELQRRNAALRARSPQASDAALIGKLRHQLAQATEECAALRARAVPDEIVVGSKVFMVSWNRKTDMWEVVRFAVEQRGTHLSSHSTKEKAQSALLAASKSGGATQPHPREAALSTDAKRGNFRGPR